MQSNSVAPKFKHIILYRSEAQLELATPEQKEKRARLLVRKMAILNGRGWGICLHL